MWQTPLLSYSEKSPPTHGDCQHDWSAAISIGADSLEHTLPQKKDYDLLKAQMMVDIF